MLVNFDVYGLVENDLERLSKSIGRILGIKFEGHESSFWGIYDLWHSSDSRESISIKPNNYAYDDPEEDWLEENFKQFPYLLYVDFTTRSREIEQRVTSALGSNIQLIRRQTLDA